VLVFAAPPGSNLAQNQTPPAPALSPTAHPALSADPAELWMAPGAADRAIAQTPPFRSFRSGAERLEKPPVTADVLSSINPAALAGTTLADYGRYYQGLAELKLQRVEQARATFRDLAARDVPGYLGQAALEREAEAAEMQTAHANALRIYDRILERKPVVAPEEILYRLGRAALASGDRRRAAQAFVRVYYEFPTSSVAALAATELSSLSGEYPPHPSRARFELDLGRAERLYGARRYAEARTAFEALRPLATGDDREVVDLRLGECDFYLGRYAATRDATRPYVARASRRAEARFFHLSALRELGVLDEYIEETRALVRDVPDSSWSEEALNNLATYYIRADEDALATETFRQLFALFPSGRRADRAAWKIGWEAYRTGEYAAAAKVFEEAAALHPRSDYRPSWLYWAARAHERAGSKQPANARLRLVFTDYQNTYYGRLAASRLRTRGEPLLAYRSVAPRSRSSTSRSSGAGVPAADGDQNDAVRGVEAQAAPPISPALPPTHATIRQLLALGMYNDARRELEYAQKAWGPSPPVDATLAYVYYEQGDLRRAINQMKRAYPHYMAAGGERLPPEMLRVLFPLAYWDLIRQHSKANGLDPYIVAALISQESTFEPTAHSIANAWGLMQIVPATGRALARRVGIRRFSTAMLTQPAVNVRLGTLYFAARVRQFGGAHHALASYNAGEHRVARWIEERPGLDQEEFIDDIPFPETQNYVKRILGTAEDYRLLYGRMGLSPRTTGSGSTATASASPAAKKKPAGAKKSTKKPTKKPPARKRGAPRKR